MHKLPFDVGDPVPKYLTLKCFMYFFLITKKILKCEKYLFTVLAHTLHIWKTCPKE